MPAAGRAKFGIEILRKKCSVRCRAAAASCLWRVAVVCRLVLAEAGTHVAYTPRARLTTRPRPSHHLLGVARPEGLGSLVCWLGVARFWRRRECDGLHTLLSAEVAALCCERWVRVSTSDMGCNAGVRRRCSRRAAQGAKCRASVEHPEIGGCAWLFWPRLRFARPCLRHRCPSRC